MNLWTAIIIITTLFAGYIALAYVRARPPENEFWLPEETETDPTIKAYIKSLWGEK